MQLARAPVVDIAGEASLSAVEIDGGDTLSSFQQRDSDMQGGGRFSRAALLITEHNDVRRARLSLGSLQHV